MRNELKISSSEKIYHVTLNENEFKTMNDLSVDNDSNNSSSNDFVLIVLFIYSTFSVAVFNATVCQDEKQFKDFKKKC